jgi:hypothetical protein
MSLRFELLTHTANALDFRPTRMGRALTVGA